MKTTTLTTSGSAVVPKPDVMVEYTESGSLRFFILGPISIFHFYLGICIVLHLVFWLESLEKGRQVL